MEKNSKSNRAVRFLKRVFDMVLPNTCIKCRKIISPQGSLCESCFKSVRFIIGASTCSKCGRHLSALGDASGICANCISSPPPYKRVVSCFYYDRNSKDLVLSLKYSDNTRTKGVFAKWMVKAFGNFEGIDVIVPVPMHFWRLVRRKYNQAAVLAMEVSRISGKKLDTSELKRVKHTKSQGHLKAKERRRNVRGCFGVRNPDVFKGKNVLLVDDVFTTGSTCIECVKELINAGAKSVEILTLSRTYA